MGVDSKASGRGAPWSTVPPPRWPLDDGKLRNELLCSPLRFTEAVRLELWRNVEKVEAWAGVADKSQVLRGPISPAVQERRRTALHEADAAIRDPLAVLINACENPAEAEAERLVPACLALAEWSGERGLSECGTRYAEAAAAIAPASAEAANAAGRLCRRAGYRMRAEMWYERAIGLARASQSLREYIRAHLGLASVLRDAGEHARALPLLKRAGLSAKRAGLRAQAAEALHDVFTIALLREDYPRAAIYARRALAVYPRHHRRLPYMAADFAGLLIRRGMFAPALSILETVRTRMTGPADQFQLHGLLAWAAAGARREVRFREAATYVERLSTAFPESRPGALYYAGEGARQLEEWEYAHRLALDAVASAEQIGDVLTVALARRLADAASKRVPGVPPLGQEDASGAVLRRIAPAVRLLVRRWHGQTWRPRRTPLG